MTPRTNLLAGAAILAAVAATGVIEYVATPEPAHATMVRDD